MDIIIPSSNIYGKTTNKVLQKSLKQIDLSVKDVDYKTENLGLSHSHNFYVSGSFVDSGNNVTNASDYRFISAYEAVIYPQKYSGILSRISLDDTNYYVQSVSPTLETTYEATIETQSFVSNFDALIDNIRINFHPPSNNTISSYTLTHNYKEDVEFNNEERIYSNDYQSSALASLGVKIDTDGIHTSVKITPDAVQGVTYSKSFIFTDDKMFNWYGERYFPANVLVDRITDNEVHYIARVLPKIEVYVGWDIVALSKISGAYVSHPVEGLKITFNLKEAKVVFGEQVRKIDILETQTQNIIDETSNGKEVISIGNDLIRTKNTYYGEDATSIYQNTLEAYKKGKETATVLCSISDYYDFDDESRVIAKDGSTGKMAFDLYDEVIPMIRNQYGADTPMTILPSGYAKKFSVLGSRFIYDGAVWQELSLQEKGLIPYGSQGLELRLMNDDQYWCTGIGSVTSSAIVIPKTHNGLPITEIGLLAFENESITSVYIQNNIKKIGGSAFINCNNLREVILTEGLEIIGASAFRGCSSIQLLVIPNSVSVIYHYAFDGCTNLQTIILPYNLTEIQSSSFRGCQSLFTIEITPLVKYIGARAFEDCSNITTIRIPNAVTRIDTDAFSGCENLTEVLYIGSQEEWNAITIGDGNEYLTNATIRFSIQFPLTYELNDDGASYSVIGVGENTDTNIIIPSKYKALPVTSIAENAFLNNTNITSISIPDSVTSISYNAFSGCTNLIIEEDGVHYVDKWIIDCDLDVTIAQIKDNIVGIAYGAFEDCENLTSIDLPQTLINIGASAFNTCLSLTSIDLPKNVTNIGASAFGGCTSLTSIIIPPNVKSILNGTFILCGSLISVTIPNGVKSIGDYAFSYCSKLSDVYYQGSEAEWNSLLSKVGTGNEPLLNATIHFNS